MQNMIVDTATRLFSEHCPVEVLEQAEQGVWPTSLWNELEKTGLHLVSIPESVGGVDGDLTEATTVLRVASQYAVPLPLAETFLAGWILAEIGGEMPDGPMTVVTSRSDTYPQFTDGFGTGVVHRVPYAGQVPWILVLGQASSGALQAGILERQDDLAVTASKNIAVEPRDTLTLENTPFAQVYAVNLSPKWIQSRGALLRCAQMVGALETILAKSVQYAGERVQFGRPIAKFQVIQQYLAELAAEVAAARAAMEAAAATTQSAESPAQLEDAYAAIAMAKIRVGEATGKSSRIAHQVHAAMGYTYEYPLHFFTKRLWAWRDEFGSETEWAQWLGEHVVQMGADDLWPFITHT
ncbi:MAG: acyl-CoA dehydrogenase family protein [Chloroflexota bacterium]